MLASGHKANRSSDGQMANKYQEDTRMDPKMKKEGFELDILIEELEAKIAPDGGETVLPLPRPKHH